MPQTGARLSEGYMGELKASDDYGLLIPYAGAAADGRLGRRNRLPLRPDDGSTAWR